jgi:hypothetical protein
MSTLAVLLLPVFLLGVWAGRPKRIRFDLRMLPSPTDENWKQVVEPLRCSIHNCTHPTYRLGKIIAEKNCGV